MPFTPPFKNYLSKGDLIYGLNSARACYSPNHGVLEYCDAIPKPSSLIWDQLPQYIIDTYNVSCIDKIANRSLLDKFTPIDEAGFYLTVSNHQKYSSILPINNPHHDISYYFENKGVIKQMISRKCKAGLYWVTHKTESSTVHFLLDFLDLHRVISSRGKSMTLKDITGMELRWIYRNRFDPKVKNRIQFWHKGKPVSPPWIDAGHAHENIWLRFYRENTRMIRSNDDDDWSSSLSQLFR